MKYWKMIRNAGKETEVDIIMYEQIGADWFGDGMTAKSFAQDLKAFGDNVTRINLFINSPGGSVFDGLAIYNQLVAHKAEVVVRIDGLAASIASVVAMAGDEIIMPENALMMIHDPWSMIMGNADELRDMAETLDKIKSGLISAYAKKSNMSETDIGDLMSLETWMTAAEALEWGFIDTVKDAEKIAAYFDISKFQKVPEAIAESYKAAPEETINITGSVIDAAALAKELAPHLEEMVANKTILNQSGKEKHKMKCPKCGDMMHEGVCPRCNLAEATAKAREKATKDEVQRAADLRAVGKEYKQDQLAEYAIIEGWTVDQLRNEILKRSKDSDPDFGLYNSPAHEGKPYQNLGEQLIDVANAARSGGKVSKKLLEVFDATGASEGVQSDGGFLVQSDFTTDLLRRSNETMTLKPRATVIPVTGNGIEAPIVDETSRATGSRWGGVRVYRTAEATAVTKSKPKFAKLEMKLEKLMAIFYATDELLEDVSVLEAIASQAFTEEFGFAVDDEMINGTGAGQMLGILKAACFVSVPKETGQLAATVVAENIIEMYARMPARNKANAIWLINSETMPQLMQMAIILGTSAFPLYFPPGGLSALPYGTIFGKPVIEIEQAAALGTVGDVMFTDWTQYAIIEKGGINAAQSIHVQFLTDEMTFRWTTRNNGQPIWKSALTPYKGSNDVAPFVGIATRA